MHRTSVWPKKKQPLVWSQFHGKHRAAPGRCYKKWACLPQKVCYVNQESDREEQVSGCMTTSGRELGEAGGGMRRDHYLSAPGREAATFGRGGGAGGFKLNYRTKTKKRTQMTQI